MSTCPYISPSGVASTKAAGDTSVQGWNTYDFSKLADIQRFADKVQQLTRWGFSVSVTQLNKPKNQVYLAATCVGVDDVVLPPPPPAPIDCALSPWTMQSAGPWGSCQSNGTQTRTETWVRAIVTAPANGGAPCGPLTETRTGTQVCTFVPPNPLPSAITYGFTTAGQATFGLALPQGVATSGVQIGSLTTQADVKNRWPDGSMKFAVVSAEIPASGTYAITPAPRPSGSFTPAWPTIAFEFVIGGVTWIASAGSFATSNLWLDGPVVREQRVKVVPKSGATSHPQLEVLFDIRAYASGARRIDVAVQNVIDAVTMDKVAASAVTLKVNGAAVWTHGAQTVYSMTRFRVPAYWSAGTEAAIVPDFEPAYRAKALPRVLSTVANTTYDLSGANYDIMGGLRADGAFLFGELQPDMSAAGGRGELAPLTFWEASYLVHKTANQRQTVLRNGDLTGCWSMHLTKPDGTMIKLGDPGYDASLWWWDGRTSVGSRPLVPLDSDTGWRGARMGLSAKSDTGAGGVPSQYNAQHVPAPMYVPYLLTGDRYYVDQAKFWSSMATASSLPYWVEPDPVNFPGWKRGRMGASGVDRILDDGGMTREFGQPLRVVAYAAWMIPDADAADKSYTIGTVTSNLAHAGAYLDYHVAHSYGGALGAIGGMETPITWGFVRGGVETGRKTAPWRMHYVAYTLDWITRQPDLWTIAPNITALTDRLVRTSVLMNVQNPGYLTGQRSLSYNYYPVFNTMSGGVFNKWLDTFADVKTYNETFAYTDGAPGNPEWSQTMPPVGYYNAYEHADLQMAIRRGIASAQAAADRLAQVPGHPDDLNARAGFAIYFQD